MSLNPPRRVRIALYLLAMLGTPLVAYLYTRGLIGDPEAVLWAAYAAICNALAIGNAGPGSPDVSPDAGH